MSDPISIGSRKLLVLLLILFSFAGCTRRLVLEQYPMKEGMVPNFVGRQPVNVINAQDSAEEVLIAQTMGEKYMADLQQCTNIAIKVLETELNKRNIMTSLEAEKKIKLTITDMDIKARAFGFFRCTLNLKVETGDGYTRVVNGSESKYASFNACNHAVLSAVAAMLNDNSIVAYLKR